MNMELWAKIIEIVTIWIPQVVTVVSIIVAATPTRKDNQIWNGIRNTLSLLALNVANSKNAD